MKISSLEIQNIKSIGDKIQLHFEGGVNIFIEKVIALCKLKA